MRFNMLLFCILLITNFSYGSMPENKSSKVEEVLPLVTWLKVRVAESKAFEKYWSQELGKVRVMDADYSTVPGALDSDTYLINFEAKHEEYMLKKFLNVAQVLSIEHCKTL